MQDPPGLTASNCFCISIPGAVHWCGGKGGLRKEFSIIGHLGRDEKVGWNG